MRNPRSLIMHLLGLLRNNRFIFLLAVTVGLTFDGIANYTEPTVAPVLGLIMTLSVLDISSAVLLDFRKIVSPILAALILNYVVLSGMLIGLSFLFIGDQLLHTGFVLVAAVPPAVAVIPFTHYLGGNTKISLVGNIAAYLAALIITPVICILFLGTNFIEPTRLLIILAELIIGPFIVSRILRRTHIVSTMDRWRGPIVNWSFFLVIYTIVGLNRDAFFQEPYTLLLISAIAFASTFALGEVINTLSRFLGVDRADRISFLLLGTRKTYGLAGAIALIFFSSRAAIPAAVTSVFSIIHFMWLTWRVKRMG